MADPVPVAGRDEIAVLASSFNTLAAKLRASRLSLEQQVEDRTADLREEVAHRRKAQEQLQARMDELKRFNRLSVDREMRMIELKRQVNGLLVELGRKERYPSVSQAADEASAAASPQLPVLTSDPFPSRSGSRAGE